MIQWVRSKAPCILCIVLALGCGGKAEIPASPSGAGSGASSGITGLPIGGQGGAGGASDAGGAASTGTDACEGKVCNTPPADACASGAEFQSYDKIGSCAAGVCSYSSHQTACACQNGACATDPCIGITCASPPAATCTDGNTQTAYAKRGTCSAGTCTYAPTDTACGSNQACAGAGVCSECRADASCGATCTACGAATPKCKDLGTTSQCVECLSNADCSAATPVCDATTNACVTPSCVGLAPTCGPNGDSNCCASSVVTGGTFNRDNDATYPAKVSDFRLDTYEITVGRFRNFWKAYPGNLPAAGSGKNPNNPGDPGWDAAWNTSSLPASQAELTTNIKCSAMWQTWTAGNDSLPMNCLDWFEAETFCIWDGGRLPTEAEWNYAAAGGTAQRAYPWGSAAPDCTYANFGGAAGGTDYCVAPGMAAVNRVGSESPKGDGLFGQADLAGNVREWVQDWYASAYMNPCSNCADMTVSSYRVVRGGAFFDSAPFLLSSYRHYLTPLVNFYSGLGARCARSAP